MIADGSVARNYILNFGKEKRNNPIIKLTTMKRNRFPINLSLCQIGLVFPIAFSSVVSSGCVSLSESREESATVKPCSPVAKYGRLGVSGTNLTDSAGNAVQLRGVSMGWHNMWPRFYNKSTVRELAREWGADFIRCSIGVGHLDNSLEHNPELAYACVDSIISGAVEEGVYVLVDFHSHPNNKELAKDFFTNVLEKYGDIPNLMFEIWNEPEEVEWKETKEYAEELIPVIRRKSPRGIVIVPTPRWDQEIDKAADDRLENDSNVMYSLHYYAATHKQQLRDKAQYALDKGLPVFMAECASMVHTGDGVIDSAEWDEWMDFADRNKVPWAAWSLSDKVETCSMLRPGVPERGEEWKDEDLKPWAVLVKHYLKRGRE